nr:zinc finger, CCHC-type [Tanacetum cinerariifolium]
MASMNTRLNIEKLDGNIVQKHGGSKQVGLKKLVGFKQLGVKQVGFKQLGVKQVGFKQLGPSVETGVHRVHDEKRVWFEVELQGAKGIVKLRFFRSTQQCVKSGVAKHLGVAGIQQQNGLVDETNVTLFAKVHCFLIRSDMSKVFWAEDTTRSTYLVNRSPSLAIGFKKPIDMNTCFNKSGKYKKTFISSGVARDREQYLVCELFGYREDSNGATFAVAAVEKIYAHESLTFNNTVALTTSMAITGAEIWATKGLLAKAKGNILSIKIVKDHSGNTLRVSQSRFYNGKLVQTLLEGHSILLLEGSLSGDCDVEKNGKWSCIYAVGSQEYQMVCTRLDIASVDVGMLDKFDRGLQTDVQVFVDFDYAIERSITVMESRYELRLVPGIATGCHDEGGTWTQVTTLLEVAECWLNIEKLDGNIIRKHGGSKQVGFKQLGPDVETGVHIVHDEKRVWFEVELQGAQGDREVKVFQEKEYQTGWKIKTGNVLDSCN